MVLDASLGPRVTFCLKRNCCRHLLLQIRPHFLSPHTSTHKLGENKCTDLIPWRADHGRDSKCKHLLLAALSKAGVCQTLFVTRLSTYKRKRGEGKKYFKKKEKGKGGEEGEKEGERGRERKRERKRESQIKETSFNASPKQQLYLGRGRGRVGEGGGYHFFFREYDRVKYEISSS